VDLIANEAFLHRRSSRVSAPGTPHAGVSLSVGVHDVAPLVPKRAERMV
jgi:hypothetical protein